MRRQLICGNWKMNGLAASAAELTALIAGLAPERARGLDLMVCPPATLIARFAEIAAGSPLAIGAQDCHIAASGAYTGDLSAEMHADAGATAVIVGHSERRYEYGEGDALVARKAEAAWRAGLVAIICVGETEAERDRGDTLDVLAHQLATSVPSGASAATTVIAYEPVWAIGTGRTPVIAEIAETHAAMRAELARRFRAPFGDQVRILYGGSVKPDNAAEILALHDVDGALVGGASLKSQDLLAIAGAARLTPA